MLRRKFNKERRVVQIGEKVIVRLKWSNYSTWRLGRMLSRSSGVTCPLSVGTPTPKGLVFSELFLDAPNWSGEGESGKGERVESLKKE